MLAREFAVPLTQQCSYRLGIAMRGRSTRKVTSIKDQRVGMTASAVSLVINRLHQLPVGSRLMTAHARQYLERSLVGQDALGLEVDRMIQFDRRRVRIVAPLHSELRVIPGE